MKRTIFYTIALTILLGSFVSCSNKKKELNTISGTVKGMDSGKIYLQRFDDKIFFNIDSTEIVDGKFSFATNLTRPEVYGLSVDTIKGSYLLFLDNNEAVIDLDSTDYYQNTKVSGSLLQDEYVAYKQLKDVKIDEYIKAHANSLVSAYILYREYAYRLNGEQIKEHITYLSPEMQETRFIKTLKELPNVYETVSIGNQAPLFSAQNPLGETVNLSDKLDKGYLLLDFWAAWCPACRQENPNIVKVYDKFKDKGFDVFGVSLDKSSKAWEKAISKDNLSWTNVSDLKFWHSEPAKLYGVRVLPSNFLIDSNGVIIAQNLKGDDLDQFLTELYSKEK